MVILPGIRVIVRRFLCIERRFLSDWSKKFYVDVLAQCAVYTIRLFQQNLNNRLVGGPVKPVTEPLQQYSPTLDPC